MSVTEGSWPERDAFFEGLSLLMSWRLVGRFRAHVVHRLGDSPERAYQLDANPRHLSYQLVNIETGKVDSYEWLDRRRVVQGKDEEETVFALTPEPLAARLAFPLSLGVWGRSFDDYRFTGEAKRHDGLLDLVLVHSKDPALQGLLSINPSRRQAVRLDTPTQYLAYESIEPLS